MESGALLQLVSVGQNNNKILLQNYNTVDTYIDIDLARNNIGFNKDITFTMLRIGDIIKQLLFNIKMNRAPRGWHYKKSWYTHFFKKIELIIGEHTVFSINSEMLQMEQLIHGETGPKEITFNYPTIEERIEKSKNTHEVIVEPLKLSKLIHSGIIRLVALTDHFVYIKIKTSSLDDILEKDNTDVIVHVQEVHNTFIQSFTLKLLYKFLDTKPRRNMKEYIHEDIIKQNCYTSKTAYTNRRTTVEFNQDNICSALYIWVTDENNNEIPNQLISHIKIKINGNNRINSSGLHCRFINKDNLPFPTIDNDKSQNLYYISYFSELNPENGAENGLNASKFESYTCEIDWNNHLYMNVKIHFVHRTNNILIIKGGMGGIGYQNNLLNVPSSA